MKALKPGTKRIGDIEYTEAPEMFFMILVFPIQKKLSLSQKLPAKFMISLKKRSSLKLKLPRT